METPATTTSPGHLPPSTIDFAHRMFDAARMGNAELLMQAIDAGLPANLTNDKGAPLSLPPLAHPMRAAHPAPQATHS